MEDPPAVRISKNLETDANNKKILPFDVCQGFWLSGSSPAVDNH